MDDKRLLIGGAVISLLLIAGIFYVSAIPEDYTEFESAPVGSTFEYKVTETYRDHPDYVCIIQVTAEVIENSGGCPVFHVTGNQYVKDGETESTEPVDQYFDTATDYWGYNMDDLVLVEESETEIEFAGSVVPVHCLVYTGAVYYEDCIDLIGDDGVLYKSTYTCPRDDGDFFSNVTELVSFEFAAA